MSRASLDRESLDSVSWDSTAPMRYIAKKDLKN